MKKSLLFFLCIYAITFNGFSQVPQLLDSEMMQYGSVATIKYAQDAGPIDTTIKGANAVWNFGALVHDVTIPDLNITIQNPNTTPNGSSFPTSNYAMVEVQGGVTSYRYFNKTSTKMERVGSYTTGLNTYSDPQIEEVFPLTLGTSNLDTWASTASSFDGNYDLTCVGYGTLTTPGGTFNDVLMVWVKMEELLVSDVYFWYDSNNGSVLLEYFVGDGFFYSDIVLYQSSSTTGIKDVFSEKYTHNISYTNPVQNILTIQSQESFSSDCEYEISNSMGEVIIGGGTQNIGEILEINCGGLTSGLYFITFKEKDSGLQSAPIKFMKI